MPRKGRKKKILHMVNKKIQDANFKTPKIKNMRRNRNKKKINSERTSTNTRVKQRTL
jgi:hypothetical protein